MDLAALSAKVKGAMSSSAKKLLSSSSIVFGGTLIASFFSYLFNMIMGRMLGPAQYGEMTAIFSFLTIISVIGGGILTVTMRYSGELYALGEYRALRKLFRIFSRYIFILAAGLFLVGLVFSKVIGRFLTIDQISPLILAFAGLFFSFLIVVSRGILQGTQRFVPLSFLGILEMILRLTLGIALVWLGFSVSGAIGAGVLATAIAYGYSLVSLRKILASRDKTGKKEAFRFDKKEIINYSLPALLASFLLVLALNVDVILVKHYFPADEAGTYAAVSTIAKIITYATTPIVAVMFPMIAEQRTIGQKHYRLFLFSLLFTLLGSLVILGIYIVMPAKVIGLLYGQSYTGLHYILPEIGMVVLLYSLISLIVSYYLAVRNFFFLWVFGLVMAVEIVAITLWHPSILAVVRILIVSLCLLFIQMIGYYLYTKKEQLSAVIRGDYDFDEAS